MSGYEIRIDGGKKDFRGQRVLRDFCFALIPNAISWIYASNQAEMDVIIEVLSGGECLDSADISRGGEALSLEEAQLWLSKNVRYLCNEDFLIEELSITDNFIICSDRKQPFWAKDKKNRLLVSSLMKRFRVDIDIDQPLLSLNALQRYQIQLLKCFFQKRYTVLVDMRKIRLSGIEMSGFMDTMRLLKQSGMSFIMIGLSAYEFRNDIDQMVIINRGITIFQDDVKGAYLRERWFDFMREAVLYMPEHEAEAQNIDDKQNSALSISHVYTEKLRDVSINIYPGEIAVIYVDAHDTGVEFFNLLKGTVEAERGTISVNNRLLDIGGDVSAHVKAGIRCISAPNAQDFFFNNFKAWENYAFTKGMMTPEIWKKDGLKDSLKNRLEKSMGERIANKYARELSQEEQLQIVFYSQVLTRPTVLVSEDPFSYVNIDKIDKMEKIFKELTERGVAILIISRFKDTYNTVKATRYWLKNTGEIVKKAYK